MQRYQINYHIRTAFVHQAIVRDEFFRAGENPRRSWSIDSNVHVHYSCSRSVRSVVTHVRPEANIVYLTDADRFSEAGEPIRVKLCEILSSN